MFWVYKKFNTCRISLIRNGHCSCSNKRMCIYCWIAFKFMHIIYCHVYVFWRWNWSNRNLVYNYISASHDVRPKFHLLMGFTPRKRALGYLLLGIDVRLRAKAVKTHLQVKGCISLQYMAFNILKEILAQKRGRNCTVCQL